MLKALFCDPHGFCMLVKRLSRGTFRIDVEDASAEGVELSTEELARLLSELSLSRRTRRSPLDGPRES
jgi:hypothetical protein